MHKIEEKVENDYFSTQKDLKILSLELTNSFDNKLNEVNKNLNNKINEVNENLNNKINEVNENLNNKINKLNLDLNAKIDKTKYFILTTLGTIMLAGFGFLSFLIEHHL